MRDVQISSLAPAPNPAPTKSRQQSQSCSRKLDSFGGEEIEVPKMNSSHFMSELGFAGNSRPSLRPDALTTDIWEQYKETIVSLYWENDKTLADVQVTMKTDHGFSAT